MPKQEVDVAPWPRRQPPGTRVGRDVEYVLVVSREREGGVSDAVVAVSDKDRTPTHQGAEPGRLRRILPRSKWSARGRRPPDSLVITVPRLRQGAAASVAFTLPIWEAIVPEGLTVDR